MTNASNQTGSNIIIDGLSDSKVIDSMVSYLVAPLLFQGLATGYLCHRYRFGDYRVVPKKEAV